MIAYPVFFSMSFLLGDAFFYQQQRGHKHTKLPGQGKVSDSELEVMNIHAGYHVPFPNYRSTIYFQAYRRDAMNKTAAAFWRTTRFTSVHCYHCKRTSWICWQSWLREHSLTYFSQNKLVSKDLLFKLSKLKHLILTESRFAVLLTDPGGQQPAAARRRLSEWYSFLPA